MITFACKNIRKEDLIRCSFDLSKAECRIFLFLMKNKGEMSASEIGRKMDKDRTTIQKYLSNLMKKSIVSRRQKNLKNGGYVFVYKIIDRKKIVKMMREIMGMWYKNALREIENME